MQARESEFQSQHHAKFPVFWELERWLSVLVALTKGPGFNSRNPHNGSKPSVTPVPGDPTGTHVVYIHAFKEQRIHTHKVNK